MAESDGKNNKKSNTAPHQHSRGNRRKKNDAGFTPRSNSIPFEYRYASSAVDYFLRRNQGFAEASYQKFGVLKQMAARDKAASARAQEWFDLLMDKVKARVAELSHLCDRYEEEYLVDIPTMVAPENYVTTVKIQNPIYWKLIDVLKLVDAQAVRVDGFWLTGVLPDSEAQEAATKINSILHTMLHLMNHVANDSRNRTGGVFSSEDYQALLAKVKAVGEAEAVDTGESSDALIATPTPPSEGPVLALEEEGELSANKPLAQPIDLPES